MESSSRDVLPAGVRRRLSRRDGMLPLVLMGELMAGMALGAVWPSLTAATAPVAPQTTTTTAVTTQPIVPRVPITPPSPSAVPVVMHPPRNPFGTPDGIDALLQVPVPVPAVVPQVPGQSSPQYPAGPAQPAPVYEAPAAPAEPEVVLQ